MEPAENSYQITIDLAGVKKAYALEIAALLKLALEEDIALGLLRDYCITTAHVKDIY